MNYQPIKFYLDQNNTLLTEYGYGMLSDDQKAKCRPFHEADDDITFEAKQQTKPQT